VVFEPVTTLTIEEIDRGWDRLEADWHLLWRELPNPTPFQTFAWVSACFRAFPDEQSRLLIARGPDRLVGIAPLVGGETIRLAGGVVSDYQDALVAPGFERMAMTAFAEHLREQPHRWSECCFENLRSESALLFGDFGPNYADTIEAHEVCPVLMLSGAPSATTGLPPSVPPHQQEKVRYYRRRAERTGKFKMETATWQNLDEYLEALFRLHRARWRTRGHNGVLEDDHVQTLHRLAAPGLFRKEVLRMYGMRMDNALVAVYLGFLSGERASYYLSGFDPAVAEFSPGMLLIAHAISEAIREKAGCFDFLRGAEPYKYAWGAHDSHTYRRTIRRV
jgi:CelD/BcsL family acetyltransferase involved in cellulose biosynthesis